MVDINEADAAANAARPGFSLDGGTLYGQFNALNYFGPVAVSELVTGAVGAATVAGGIAKDQVLNLAYQHPALAAAGALGAGLWSMKKIQSIQAQNLKEREKNLKVLREKRPTLEKEHKELQGKLNEAKGNLAASEKNKNALDKQKAKLQQVLKEQDETISKLERRKTEILQEIINLTKTNHTTRAKLNVVQASESADSSVALTTLLVLAPLVVLVLAIVAYLKYNHD